LQNKSSKKHPKKFHILMDAAFADSSKFPRLSKKANLAHVVLDYGVSPHAEDEEIYQVAVKENRFVLTINVKDFKKLVRPGKSGVLGIESQLSNEEIDNLVTDFISTKDPDDFIGKTVKIISSKYINN
jgi:predicted nuclease of predicted toxin-antitoxin system